MDLILFAMRYFHQPFEDFTNKKTKIGSFFVHSRSFMSFSGICGQLLTLVLVATCLASQILFDPENRTTLASQTTEISSIMHAVITWDQVIGLPDRVTPLRTMGTQSTA